jgi:Effector Associated Constant Component 1
MSQQRGGDGVEIRISVADGDQADLESLDDWLRGEPELAGQVKAAGSPPTRGHLGALTEVLTVALGSGGAITVLAASLKGWLSLPRRSDVTVKIDRADGSSVTIAAKRVAAGQADIELIIRQALDSGTAQE